MFAGIFLSVRPLFRHVVESSSICCYRVSLISYTVFIWISKVYGHTSRIMVAFATLFRSPFSTRLPELRARATTALIIISCSYTFSCFLYLSFFFIRLYVSLSLSFFLLPLFFLLQFFIVTHASTILPHSNNIKEHVRSSTVKFTTRSWRTTIFERKH